MPAADARRPERARNLVAALAAGWMLACGQAVAAPANYLHQLIARARAENLASRREWLDLGHYRPGLLGSGLTSLIDSPGFFNAAGGKVDPEAELEATLAAFFAGPAPGDRPQHPQCAFPARYHWLKSVSVSTPPGCRSRPARAWRTSCAINAERVTLIFPAAYLNNPSSMFGHTLLRLDRAGQDEHRLLSYAVNYGAVTGNDNGLLFAVYGLTGVYPGTYPIKPYYQLVRQYTDFENRDIWEYQLNLTPVEVRRLLEHLWELREQSAAYYFFDENCSYQLLFLLDVARPGLRLTDRFPLYAIPVDTVRAVVRQDDMLAGTVFRPSSRTRIEQGLAALTPAERELAHRLADGALAAGDPELEALAPARRAAVLELAAEIVTYRMRTGERPREQAAGLAWQLLAARSQIAVAASTPPVPEPAVRPDQGHGSARIGLGLGARDGRFFQSLSARPGYHTLSDPEGGYVRGAAIDFLDLELRHYADDRGPTLNRLTVVGIRSLSPRDELFRPVSWQLGGGLDRFRRDGHDEKGALVGALWGVLGGGRPRGPGLASLMGEAKVTAGPDCATPVLGPGPGLDPDLAAHRALDRPARQPRSGPARRDGHRPVRCRPRPDACAHRQPRAQARSPGGEGSRRPADRMVDLAALVLLICRRLTAWALLALALTSCTGLVFQPMRELVLTPGEIGLDWREVAFTTADGVRLDGWFLPAHAQHLGSVLFLHGNAQNISTTSRRLLVPAAGFDVFLFDYRGYGHSQGEPSLDGLQEDFAAALRTLLAMPEADPARIVIFGQSLGGAIAITGLAASPDKGRVRALVVDGAFASLRALAREKLAGFWLTWPLQRSAQPHHRRPLPADRRDRRAGTDAGPDHPGRGRPTRPPRPGDRPVRGGPPAEAAVALARHRTPGAGPDDDRDRLARRRRRRSRWTAPRRRRAAGHRRPASPRAHAARGGGENRAGRGARDVRHRLGAPVETRGSVASHGTRARLCRRSRRLDWHRADGECRRRARGDRARRRGPPRAVFPRRRRSATSSGTPGRAR